MISSEESGYESQGLRPMRTITLIQILSCCGVTMSILAGCMFRAEDLTDPATPEEHQEPLGSEAGAMP